MKKYFAYGATALLLVGAGCSQNTPSAPVKTPPTNQPSTTSPNTANTFTLTVAALDNKEVKINFTIPEADKKDAEGYRILMGREANPDMKTASDWYTLGKDHMQKMWANRPEGKRHFRVCVIKQNTCTSYSNNVEVEIK